MVTEEWTAKMARLAVWKVKRLPVGRRPDRAPRAQLEVQEWEVEEEAVLEASKLVTRVLSLFQLVRTGVTGSPHRLQDKTTTRR